MRRVLIALGVLVAIIVTAVVTSVVVLNSIDWSEYNEPIAEAVRDATGRELALGGELSLQIGLTPGVAAHAVTFGNAAWGSRNEMATIDRLVVRLRLLPLLFGSLEVERVELIGLDVLLETNARGVGNWVFAEAPARGTPEEAPAAEGDAAEGSAGFAAVLHEAIIEDASLVYKDGKTGKVQELAIERLTASAKDASSPLRVELRATYLEDPIELEATFEGLMRILDGDALGLELQARAGGATIDVGGRIEKPLEGTGIALDVVARGDTIAGFSGLAQSPQPDLGPYRISLKLEGGGDEYRFRNLSISMKESVISGDAKVALRGDRPRIEAKLGSPRIDLADFQAAGTGAGEAAPSDAGDGRLFPDDPLPLDGLSAADARLSLEIGELRASDLTITNLAAVVDLDRGILVVKPVRLSLPGGSVAASLKLDSSRAPAAFATTATIDEMDLGKLLEAFGSDVVSGMPLDLQLDVSGRGRSVRGIMASLAGKLEIETGRGSARNAWAEIAMADLGKLLQTRRTTGGAAINCIVADFDVSGGVAKPRELVIDTESLSLFGSGQIDLRSEKLALAFDRQMRTASASSVLPPFKIAGTLAAPTAALDTRALAGSVLDLGVSILAGPSTAKAPIEAGAAAKGCHELHASYVEAKSDRPASAAKAIENVLQDGGKGALGALKGLLKR